METQARAILAAGDVYLATFVNGVPGPMIGPFEADKFAVTPKSELKNAVSKGKTSYGQVVESVSVPGVVDFEIALTQVNKTSLAIAILGDAARDTAVAGTLAATAFTADVLDAWIDTGKPLLTDVVVTNTGATTTYDEGVDYQVNSDMGWVQPLSTGAITAGESIKIGGTFAALSETTITAMTNSQLRVYAVFDGINLVDQSGLKVICYEVVLAAKDVFDFLLSDFNKVTLSGSMKTPVGKLTPFIVKLVDPA
jgi:hypothetical protein